MLTRIIVVAAGGLGVAAVLDALLSSSDDGPEPEPDDDEEPDPGDGGGDPDVEQRLEELRSTIDGHLERLDGRVPEELGDRLDTVLERVEAQRTASTDLLERLRSLEERLEAAGTTDDDDGGPTGGEPPEDSSHDDGD